MNYYESNNINTSANTIKAFWSWNDKLDKDLLIKQLEDIKKSGMTGFFMHARAGLLTEYMSEEWLYCIKVSLEKAKELGLGAWFYDENGWPSGFANGAVPKKGTDFRQKWLDIEIYSQNKELPNNIIGFYQQKNDTFIKISRPTDGCLIIRFDINRFYIDALNEKAIECFIENTHDIYYNTFKEYFGNTIQGFFTDEPQYGNNGKIPWSQVLPEKFYDTYGYDLIECLPALFYKTKNHTAVRNDFYSLISSVFVSSFIKKMYDWCEAHHCKLTGHMMAEDNIANQVRCTGGVMPCYQYFHEPGIDWLGRIIGNPLTPKQLGSVAAQLKKKTITESFALCGWDVSLNELKWISQWQYVNGVTSICPHLEAYFLRGMRKCDYPAAVFTQVPWFENNFGYFNKYMSNLGALLDSGKDYAPLLVLHPIKSAYLYANPKDSSELTEYSNDFSDCSSGLSENHFLYHYADEEILKNFGSVTGNEIKIGACIYRYVFLPRITNISRSTFSILFMFSLNGGKIISFNEKIQFVEGRTFDELNSLNNKIIQISSFNELREILTDCRFTRIITDNTENKSIYCCEKTMPDKSRIFYTVNLSSEKQHTEIYIKDAVSVRKLNVINGEYEAVAFRADGEDLIVDMTFDAYGSAVFELNNVNKEVLASPIKWSNRIVLYLHLKAELFQ